MMILPRQARDKDRESTQKRDLCARVQVALVSDLHIVQPLRKLSAVHLRKQTNKQTNKQTQNRISSLNFASTLSECVCVCVCVSRACLEKENEAEKRLSKRLSLTSPERSASTCRKSCRISIDDMESSEMPVDRTACMNSCTSSSPDPSVSNVLNSAVQPWIVTCSSFF
jgi:hypothetical protein